MSLPNQWKRSRKLPRYNSIFKYRAVPPGMGHTVPTQYSIDTIRGLLCPCANTWYRHSTNTWYKCCANSNIVPCINTISCLDNNLLVLNLIPRHKPLPMITDDIETINKYTYMQIYHATCTCCYLEVACLNHGRTPIACGGNLMTIPNRAKNNLSS